MAAFACLRVIIDVHREPSAALEALEPLIEKITSAFLESRWLWPRRFTPVSHSAFMLSDPRVQQLDGLELQLASELQLKLFGANRDGDVALLLCEGEEADLAGFVGMPSEDLKRAAKEGIWPDALSGTIRQITAEGETSPLMQRPATGSQCGPPPQGSARPMLDAHYRGIYFSPQQVFVGNVIAPSRPQAAIAVSVVDGPGSLPADFASTFDAECVAVGVQTLSSGQVSGVLAFPVSFSAIARRSTRESYASLLSVLAPSEKSRLAAMVYDAPRAPSFHAIAQLREVLGDHFGLIDLFTSDPDIEIDGLPRGAINFVTLMLPQAEDRVRHAAVQRFMERRDIFKRHEIWPGVSNVRTHADLVFCLQHRTPFMTGLAVCGRQAVPLARSPYEAAQLPYHAPTRASAEARVDR